MIYIVTINDKVYEVEVEKGRANIASVHTVSAPVAAAPVQAAPVQAAPVAAAPPSAGAAVSGDKAIKSPMPGTILDIKVKPGQSVKKGEILLILEAMKMENEIVAPMNGVIEQIYVAKGASVATNDMLIAIQ